MGIVNTSAKSLSIKSSMIITVPPVVIGTMSRPIVGGGYKMKEIIEIAVMNTTVPYEQRTISYETWLCRRDLWGEIVLIRRIDGNVRLTKI